MEKIFTFSEFGCLFETAFFFKFYSTSFIYHGTAVTKHHFCGPRHFFLLLFLCFRCQYIQMNIWTIIYITWWEVHSVSLFLLTKIYISTAHLKPATTSIWNISCTSFFLRSINLLIDCESTAEHHHGGSSMMLPEPTQLFVENHLMKLLAQSPDGTLMCCANDTQLKFVDSRWRCGRLDINVYSTGPLPSLLTYQCPTLANSFCTCIDRMRTHYNKQVSEALRDKHPRAHHRGMLPPSKIRALPQDRPQNAGEPKTTAIQALIDV